MTPLGTSEQVGVSLPGGTSEMVGSAMSCLLGFCLLLEGWRLAVSVRLVYRRALDVRPSPPITRSIDRGWLARDRMIAYGGCARRLFPSPSFHATLRIGPSLVSVPVSPR